MTSKKMTVTVRTVSPEERLATFEAQQRRKEQEYAEYKREKALKKKIEAAMSDHPTLH